MTASVAQPTPGRATEWEPFVCDPWRAQVMLEVSGLAAAPYLGDDGKAAVLPPTFLVGQRVDAALLDVPDAPVRLNAGNWCRWETAVTAGESLERRTVLASVTRKTGRSGELYFYQLDTTYRRPGGEPVATTSTTTIRRYPAAEPAEPRRTETGPATGTTTETTADPLAGAKQIVDLMPSSRDVVRYAAASDDFYEVHYDQDFARERGLPGTITHGLLKLAYLARAAADWGGPGTFVREVSATYRGMDLVGERFRVFAQLSDAAGNQPPDSTRLLLHGVSANDGISTTGSALITTEGDHMINEVNT